LGTSVRSARKETQMTQYELAKIMNVTKHHITEIENAHEKPSFDLLVLLVIELNLNTDWIFKGNNGGGFL